MSASFDYSSLSACKCAKSVEYSENGFGRRDVCEIQIEVITLNQAAYREYQHFRPFVTTANLYIKQSLKPPICSHQFGRYVLIYRSCVEIVNNI